jgi:peptide/nickel transport system ATP-binding protein/oligopeptide transport system ATP-binding protein
MVSIIEINNIKKFYYLGRGPFKQKYTIKAVDNISFKINRNEILGLVGESGCGKTTCGKIILRIIDPTEGNIIYDGNDITKLSQRELSSYRRRMMIIYQDPYASLDPRMKIGSIIAEPMEIHKLYSKDEREKKENKIIELMQTVGLSQNQINRYPPEFSGGQRQRIGIARALATNPEFIVADEPVSALDVSIQAQIINLLKNLQKELGLTILFITHDLSVIKHMCDRVAVMYTGKIVEMAPTDELFKNPLHPYTKTLLTAIPIPNPDIKKKPITFEGEVPSLINLPKGCTFHPRCEDCRNECSIIEPELREISKNHFVACL